MSKRKNILQRIWDKTSHPTRDGVLFLIGVGGIIWETLGEDVDRPYLLAVFCAMVGLPVFLHTDEKIAKDKVLDLGEEDLA